MSSSTRQELDVKTGRPIIESVMSYKENPPHVKKKVTYKPGLPKAKPLIFKPRENFMATPVAQDLRASNGRKKIEKAQPGSLSDMDGSGGAGNDDDGFRTRPAGMGAFLNVKSLGMVSDKITREGLSAEERMRKSKSSMESIKSRKIKEAVLNDRNVDIDLFTGDPKNGNLSYRPPKKSKQDIEHEAADQRSKDIFGKPLPKRPATADPTAAAREQPTAGEEEHYERLLKAVGQQKQAQEMAATASGQVPASLTQPKVGAAPGMAVSGLQRPPAQAMPQVDLLGQPLKPWSAKSGQDPNKKKMFPTDDEGVQIFGAPGSGLKPAALQRLQEEAWKQRQFGGGGARPSSAQAPPRRNPLNRQGLPGYIANPPQGVYQDSHPNPNGAACPPAGPGALDTQSTASRSSIRPASASGRVVQVDYTRFYASSTYQVILKACKGWGIRKLRFFLQKSDADNDGMISKNELRTAMMKFGADLEDTDLDKLMKIGQVSDGAVAGGPITKKAIHTALTAKGAAGPVTAKEKAKIGANQGTEGLPLVLIPKLMEVLSRGESTGNAANANVGYQPFTSSGTNLGCSQNAKRRQVIASCWKRALELTHKAATTMTLDDLENVIDFTKHRTFQPESRGSLRSVLQGFTSSWGESLQRNSVLSQEMFNKYFTDMGVSYSKDSEYVKMMQGMFRMTSR